MGVVERFKRKLKALEASINPSIKKSINANKKVLIKMQTDDQFYNGEDSNDQQIFPSYAYSTYLIKKRKGQKVSNVTLKDSGDLYKSIKIEATASQMMISANVDYFKYLVLHYHNNELLGIQDYNLKIFIDKYILPNIESKFKAIIAK